MAKRFYLVLFPIALLTVLAVPAPAETSSDMGGMESGQCSMHQSDGDQSMSCCDVLNRRESRGSRFPGAPVVLSLFQVLAVFPEGGAASRASIVHDVLKGHLTRTFTIPERKPKTKGKVKRRTAGIEKIPLCV
jgi:hypothetical protein